MNTVTLVLPDALQIKKALFHAYNTYKDTCDCGGCDICQEALEVRSATEILQKVIG